MANLTHVYCTLEDSAWYAQVCYPPPPPTPLYRPILRHPSVKKRAGHIGGVGGGGGEGGGGAIWELKEGSSKIRNANWVSQSAVEVTVNSMEQNT
jgi:hypothetical protein